MHTRQVLSAVAVSAVSARAAELECYTNTWYSATTRFEGSLVCSTEYGSTWVHPIPTSYTRFATTITEAEPLASMLTTAWVTANETVTTPRTFWDNITRQTTITADSTTTITQRLGQTTGTIATITNPTTVCTNDVTPTATVTSYTGTYTPLPGQPTALPETWETAVFCDSHNTQIEHIWPTVECDGTTTSTVTNTVQDTTGPIVSITYTNDWTWTVPRWTATVTASSYRVATETTTVSTACEPTETVTLAAQCAPQNLIGELDNLGLAIGTFHRNFTSGTTPWSQPQARDPSLCCQLCVETEGCIAMHYYAMSNICSLSFVGGEGRCNAPALDYYAVGWEGVPTKPWQGMIFALGAEDNVCGGIEYTGVRTS